MSGPPLGSLPEAGGLVVLPFEDAIPCPTCTPAGVRPGYLPCSRCDGRARWACGASHPTDRPDLERCRCDAGVWTCGLCDGTGRQVCEPCGGAGVLLMAKTARGVRVPLCFPSTRDPGAWAPSWRAAKVAHERGRVETCAPWTQPDYEAHRRARPVGLGTWRLSAAGFAVNGQRVRPWLYLCPDGDLVHADGCYTSCNAEPPPLPRPPSQRHECGCYQGPHTCSACGRPNWIEIHGCADGRCSYCYYSG